MKTIWQFLPLCLLLMAGTCEPETHFTSPLPIESKSIDNFPSSYLGEYKLPDSSCFISIQKKLVLVTYLERPRLHRVNLDSNLRIFQDSLYDLTTGLKTKVRFFGDSLTFDFTTKDSLFSSERGDELRKWKGYLFLNSRVKEGAWKVRKLQLKKDKLELAVAGSEKDLEILFRLTQTKPDTQEMKPFLLKKGDLNTFLKEGGFEKTKQFIRMSP